MSVGSKPCVATEAEITRRYWKGAAHELVELGCATRLSTESGRPKYQARGPLPDYEELSALVTDTYTKPLGEWFARASSECNAVLDFLGVWRDDLYVAGLKEKYREVRGCYKDLDRLVGGTEFTPPVELEELRVSVQPSVLFVTCAYRTGKKRKSCTWQLREVASILEACLEVAERADPGSDAETYLADMKGFLTELEAIELPLQRK